MTGDRSKDLSAVVMEGHLAVVHTRKVHPMVAALVSQGGTSKLRVSVIFSDIGLLVYYTISRPLEGQG